MSTESTDSSLRALDRGAERIVEDLLPLRVERARDAADVDACLRMRREMAVEMGWARPEDHPDGREHDADDDRAFHLVCRDGDLIVACMRAVMPRPDRPLPVERHFGVRLPEAFELGRLVVGAERRGAAALPVVAGLFAKAWLEGRALGMHHALAAAAPAMVELYRGMGIELRELGAARPHHGEDRVPVAVQGVRGFLGDGAVDAGDARARLTRRRLLVGVAGVATLGVPAAAAAQSGRPRPVGAGPTDRTTLSLIARVNQVGRELSAVGHLTRIEGLALASLYTRPPGVSSTDPAAADLSLARFTFVVRARIAALRVLGSAITAAGAGTAAIHLLPQGGADLADPASFAAGRAIVTFSVRFQNDLALDSPDNAATALQADLTQRAARAFTLGGRRLRIGAAQTPWVLRASGRGVRTEPSTPRSQFSLAGGLAVVDGLPLEA